jgi:hypothetical protein
MSTNLIVVVVIILATLGLAGSFDIVQQCYSATLTTTTIIPSVNTVLRSTFNFPTDRHSVVSTQIIDSTHPLNDITCRKEDLIFKIYSPGSNSYRNYARS